MSRPFQLVLVGVMAASLAACSTIQVTPHLPSLQWQTPPNPAPTQPATESTVEPVA